jgi:dolichyl-diphosphooligosaccharide--protein glycosyltransferase
MLFACFGQNRFAYYYAVNVALLCGVASWKLIELVDSKKEDKKRTKGKSKKLKSNDVWQKYKIPIVCILLFFVVIASPLSISLKVAKYPSNIPSDWYDALTWMHNNTPETGVDYYNIYEAPPKGEDYNYPDTAYSVMSWWDYGHWITTIAHRIPFANPFQAGATTAAEYLISTEEDKANKILGEVNSKYVVLDYPICDFMGAPTNPNPKYVMPIWTGKNPDPLRTIMCRLYYFDGSEVDIGGGEVIPALQHYRLVYESQTFVLPFVLIDIKTGRTLGWNAYHSSYDDIESQIGYLYQGARVSSDDDIIAQTPLFFKPMSFVKVFEYVEGFTIKGSTENISTVIITKNITSNQGREFTYTQKVLSNGTYEVTVPYEGDYIIRVGQVVDQTMVWEEEKHIFV